MKSQQLIPLGALITPKGKVRTPWIRSHRERTTWATRNAQRSTIAFYNDGEHLFIDPLRNPANTYYHYPWERVRFRDFSTPRYILASNNKFAGILNDIVIFKDAGHDPRDRHAKIRIGAIWNPYPHEEHVPQRTKFHIPPYCILYVAVKWGHVKETLLVSQPLPQDLTRLSGPYLKDTPCQVLTAVELR